MRGLHVHWRFVALRICGDRRCTAWRTRHVRGSQSCILVVCTCVLRFLLLRVPTSIVVVLCCGGWLLKANNISWVECSELLACPIVEPCLLLLSNIQLPRSLTLYVLPAQSEVALATSVTVFWFVLQTSVEQATCALLLLPVGVFR